MSRKSRQANNGRKTLSVSPKVHGEPVSSPASIKTLPSGDLEWSRCLHNTTGAARWPRGRNRAVFESQGAGNET